MNNLSQLVRTGEAVVVDVRTPMEFSGGNVSGSINIPLNEIPERMDELREMKHMILCCASGARSSQATQFLQSQGISCENGGSWLNVNYHMNIN